MSFSHDRKNQRLKLVNIQKKGRIKVDFEVPAWGYFMDMKVVFKTKMYYVYIIKTNYYTGGFLFLIFVGKRALY